MPKVLVELATQGSSLTNTGAKLLSLRASVCLRVDQMIVSRDLQPSLLAKTR